MALFKKDKDKKKKGQEGLIGKIIYACLLFAPIFSVLVSCMYVVFNKNAYQSYSQNNDTAIQYDNVETASELVIGETYNFNNSFLNLPTITTQKFIIFYTTNVHINYSPAPYINSSMRRIAIYRLANQTNNDTVIYTYDENDVLLGNGTLNKGTLIDFDFIFQTLSSTTNYNDIFHQYFYTKTLPNTTNTLDNVFEYSLTKVEDSNYYNWSKQTGTYTVLETTCEGLGITNTFTPMLLAYWLIISIIYFLYDIALILIWAVHDKIHELKESI